LSAQQEKFSLFKSVWRVQGACEGVSNFQFTELIGRLANEYVSYPKWDDGFYADPGDFQGGLFNERFISRKQPSGECFIFNDDHYAVQLRRVKKDATSGQPWSAFGRTKGDVIDCYPTFLKMVVKTRLEFFANQDPVWFYDKTPEDLVRFGVCDPVRVFQKNELHSVEKLKSRGSRLIWNVSIADELVHRYLFGEQDEEEIIHHREIPSQCGMGLTDGHINDFKERVYQKMREHASQHPNDGTNGDASDSDVSGWDMCVKLWMMILDVETRAVLQYQCTTLWRRAAINVVTCLSLALVILSDGSMYAIATPGIQKSGVKITGSTNSRIRRAVDILVGVSWSYVMSDDDVSAYVYAYPSKLARYGVTVKTHNRFVLGQTFEFCSTTMGEGIAEPRNMEKMVGHLLTNHPDLMLLSQFRYETRNSPEQEVWLEVIKRSGWMDDMNPYPAGLARLVQQKPYLESITELEDAQDS
jgi:hypothetical protein